MKFNTVPFFFEPTPGEGGGQEPIVGQTTFGQFASQFDPEPEPEPSPDPEPTPGQEPAGEPAPAAQPAQQQEPPKDWREVAKDDEVLSHVKAKFDRRALLTAAGVDEETIKAIEFKESNNGDWSEYLRVKNTDYKSIPAEKLIEMDLREKYKDLPEEKFNVVLRSNLKKYNLDREDYPEGSDEATIGEIELARDAEAIRTRFIEKQDSLKAPEKAPDTTAQDQAAKVEKITGLVRNSGAVRAITENKTVSFGEGEEAFNYEIPNVQNVVDAAVSAILSTGNEPTEADIQDVVSSIAIMADKKGFIKAILDHGKILGERGTRKAAANAQPAGGGATPPDKGKTAAQALATEGQFARYGDV